MSSIIHRSIPHSDRVPLGTAAFAGIIVACFVIPALLALGFSLLWRRSHIKKTRQTMIDNYQVPLREIVDRLPRSYGNDIYMSFVGCTTGSSGVSNLTRIMDTDTPFAPSILNQDLILSLLDEKSRSEGDWPAMLCDSDHSSRIDNIRLYVLKVVCARIDPLGDLETTLLPVPVMSCWRSVNETDDKFATDNQLMYWRMFSCHLMSVTYPRKTAKDSKLLPEADPRYPAIQKTIDGIALALQPLRLPDPEGTFLEELTQMVHQAAIFGWDVFGQPRVHKIHWAEGDVEPSLANWGEAPYNTIMHIYGSQR